MPTTKILIATGNAGKLREIRAALAGCGAQLPSSAELNIGSPAEPHGTFMENALAKARYAAKESGLPALADDSGLVVAALGGKPGVHSARYAGNNASDKDNNDKLMQAMQSAEQQQGATLDRSAYYYAAMVFARDANDPAPLFADGYWRGEILKEPRGENGFGYDPLFYDATLGKTGAQMTPEEKNKVSHRGKSLRAITALLIERGIIKQ